MPVNHMNTNCMAVLYQLEAIRKFAPNCRYYNAGSSEEFGDVSYAPQNEAHPLRPRSPYGSSKAAARHLVKVYRDSYSIYAIQGWLFNHEGTRRGEEFVDISSLELIVPNLTKLKSYETVSVSTPVTSNRSITPGGAGTHRTDTHSHSTSTETSIGRMYLCVVGLWRTFLT